MVYLLGPICQATLEQLVSAVLSRILFTFPSHPQGDRGATQACCFSPDFQEQPGALRCRSVTREQDRAALICVTAQRWRDGAALGSCPFSPLRTQRVSIHQRCREVSPDSICHAQKSLSSTSQDWCTMPDKTTSLLLLWRGEGPEEHSLGSAAATLCQGLEEIIHPCFPEASGPAAARAARSCSLRLPG